MQCIAISYDKIKSNIFVLKSCFTKLSTNFVKWQKCDLHLAKKFGRTRSPLLNIMNISYKIVGDRQKRVREDQPGRENHRNQAKQQ